MSLLISGAKDGTVTLYRLFVSRRKEVEQMFPSDMDIFIASAGVIAVQCELRIQEDGIHVRSRLAPIPETDEMAISVFLMCASHLAEGTPLESAIDACLDLKDAMLRQKTEGAGSENTASSASVGDDV